MERIFPIVDFGGFRIDGAFRVREMGYFSLTNGERGSYRFNLRSLRLSEKDWKGIIFSKKKIHGLFFRPWIFFRPLQREKELFRFENLDRLILNDYHLSKRSGRNFVAYKDGQVERGVLDDLDLPAVNLDNYGCPKYDDLPHPKYSRDCGYHLGLIEKYDRIHYPTVECEAFINMILENS